MTLDPKRLDQIERMESAHGMSVLEQRELVRLARAALTSGTHTVIGYDHNDMLDYALKSREGWASPETYQLTLDAVKAEAVDAIRYRAMRDALCSSDDTFLAAVDRELEKYGDATNITAEIIDAVIDLARKESARG